MYHSKQSDVLIRVLREELSEPGLHDEPLPIKMCEVILQSGNVRLEPSNSESTMYWMILFDYVLWF